eukprot:8528051-Pyramimonas_sp.AAC.1
MAPSTAEFLVRRPPCERRPTFPSPSRRMRGRARASPARQMGRAPVLDVSSEGRVAVGGGVGSFELAQLDSYCEVGHVRLQEECAKIVKESSLGTTSSCFSYSG